MEAASLPATAPGVRTWRETALYVGTAVATVLLVGFVPASWTWGAGAWLGAAVRGAIAGVACALCLRERPRWAAPSVAAAAVLLVAFVRPATFAGGPAPWPAVLAGLVAVGAALGAGAAPRRLDRAIAAGTLALMLAWTLGQAAFVMAPSSPERPSYVAVLDSPPARGWTMDGWLFLRIHVLMREGKGYYRAFSEAEHVDGRFNDQSLTSAFNYREPLTFLIWDWLPSPSPSWLLGYFYLFGAGGAAFAYLLAARFTSRGFALLSPALVMWLYHFVAMKDTPWFTFIELWGAPFAIAALWALATRRWVASAALLVAAVAMRELFVLALPAWLLALWLSPDRKRGLLPAGLLVGGVAVALGAHLALVAPWVEAGARQPFQIGTWLNGGVGALANAMRLGRGGRESYAPGPLPYMVAGAGVLGAALLKPRWRLAGAFGWLLSGVAFLLVFSRNEWGFYWGFTVVPLLMACAPLVMARLAPAEPAADERPPDAAAAP